MLSRAILLGLLMCLVSLPAQAELFGMRELKRSGLGAFTKWTSMLARADQSIASPSAGSSGGCQPNPRWQCPSRAALAELIRQVRDSPRLAQLRAINELMNRQRYVLDSTNWGVEDYWETLDEFLERGGDCEDFAIAKYMALKMLGVPIDDMRIVILQDENLNVAHAVLAVRDGGATYILDNQIGQVLPDSAISHYHPFYSINEHSWWVYSPKTEP